MSTSGQEALPDVREWSGVHPECLRVVRRPSRLTARVREALPDVQDGQEPLPDVREWS